MGTMTVSVMQYPAVGHGPQQTPAMGFPAASLGSEQKGAEDFAGTALATVLDGLRNWTIFAGVDWSSRSKAAVPFPRVIDEQDIAKVTAYSAGVPQLHYLADLVKLENPREAYPPLVCLAAMVPRAHWRQQEVLQERFSPSFLTEYAAEGHPQCRVAAVRLLLRLWGGVMSPRCAAKLLKDRETAVRNDAALVLAEICLRGEKALLEIGTALLEGGRAKDTAESLIEAAAFSPDPQVQDGMMILLASLCCKLCGQNECLGPEIISALLQYRSDAFDQVNMLLLHTVAYISTKLQWRIALVGAGGMRYLQHMLMTMNSTRKYYEAAFENTLETSLELVLKILQNLLDGCNIETEIRFEELIKNAIQYSKFHRHHRSQLVRNRYGLPLLSRLLK